MKSLYNLYIKNDIMTTCEGFINKYLEEEGSLEKEMTPEDRVMIEEQIDFIIDMITELMKEHEDNELEAIDKIIDKLVGYCIITKISEVMLCRNINELIDENEKLKRG